MGEILKSLNTVPMFIMLLKKLFILKFIQNGVHNVTRPQAAWLVSLFPCCHMFYVAKIQKAYDNSIAAMMV